MERIESCHREVPRKLAMVGEYVEDEGETWLDEESAREVVNEMAEILREHGGQPEYGKELIILGLDCELQTGAVAMYGFDPSRKRGPLFTIGILPAEEPLRIGVLDADGTVRDSLLP